MSARLQLGNHIGLQRSDSEILGNKRISYLSKIMVYLRFEKSDVIISTAKTLGDCYSLGNSLSSNSVSNIPHLEDFEDLQWKY